MPYTYALTNSSSILRSDGAFVPQDLRNVDYIAYQAWLAAGNTPTAAPTINLLPQQAHTALTKTDITVLRCYSAGVSVPTDWQTYRVALRAIATGKDTTSTILPTEPTNYPPST